MFQVKISSQQLEICKSVCMFVSLAITMITDHDLMKKCFGPMIADQDLVKKG